MAVIIVFKDISGKELASLNQPSNSEEERLFQDALKFRVGNTIKFNFGTRYLGYRIASINRKFASPEAFGQNEPIMKMEFTLEEIENSEESA